MANITTQTIRVDLNTGKVIPTAFVHQNDTARTLVFSMYLNDVPYTMTGHTVKFAYQSPIVNGQYTVITGNSMATGTVSGSTVSVTLPVAYTQISGVGMLTMIITPTSGTVRPVNIRLVVQKSADGADVVAGASDFVPVLEQYMAENMQQYINDWLDDHPEATTTIQDGTLTEAKFSEALKLKAIKDYITPEMYGAKGNGTTDDTAAFQSMFDDVTSGTYSGKAVAILFKNYYKLTSGFTLSTTQGLKFFGVESGDNSVGLLYTGSGTLFTFDTSRYVTFDGVTFNGTNKQGTAIKTTETECRYLFFNNCCIKGFDTAFEFNSGYYSYIHETNVTGCNNGAKLQGKSGNWTIDKTRFAYISNIGIRMEQTYRAGRYVNGNIFRSCTFENNLVFIHQVTASETVVDSCYFGDGTSTGIYIDSGDMLVTNACAYVMGAGTTLADTGTAFELGATARLSIRECVFSRNVSGTFKLNGAAMLDIKNCRFNDYKILNYSNDSYLANINGESAKIYSKTGILNGGLGVAPGTAVEVGKNIFGGKVYDIYNPASGSTCGALAIDYKIPSYMIGKMMVLTVCFDTTISELAESSERRTWIPNRVTNEEHEAFKAKYQTGYSDVRAYSSGELTSMGTGKDWWLPVILAKASGTINIQLNAKVATSSTANKLIGRFYYAYLGDMDTATKLITKPDFVNAVSDTFVAQYWNGETANGIKVLNLSRISAYDGSITDPVTGWTTNYIPCNSGDTVTVRTPSSPYTTWPHPIIAFYNSDHEFIMSIFVATTSYTDWAMDSDNLGFHAVAPANTSYCKVGGSTSGEFSDATITVS